MERLAHQQRPQPISKSHLTIRYGAMNHVRVFDEYLNSFEVSTQYHELYLRWKAQERDLGGCHDVRESRQRRERCRIRSDLCKTECGGIPVRSGIATSKLR